MYEGPIVYESQVIDYFALTLGFMFILLIIVLFCWALGKIFQKADKKFRDAWIPFYNIYLLIKITNLSNIYFLLMFVPFINIFAIYQLNTKLALVFKKSSKFKWGLIFLPFIFYPMLGFSKDRYIGINEEKVEEIVLPDLIKEQVDDVTHSTVIKADENINIGTSSKGVTSTNGVLQVDDTILNQKKVEPVEYIECPDCKNKVKKGVPVCFICGHKF